MSPNMTLMILVMRGKYDFFAEYSTDSMVDSSRKRAKLNEGSRNQGCYAGAGL